MIRLRLPAVFVALWMVSACDARVESTRTFLAQRIAAESGGAIQLKSFQRTKAEDHDFQKVRICVLEWQADVLFQRDALKSGNELIGYWGNFTVRSGTGDSLVGLAGSQRFAKGAEVRLNGETTLLQEAGRWVPQNAKVRSGRVLR